MKILFLYTKRMLAANKARTAVTFAGIVLSFALLTAVITGTSSLFHFFSEFMKVRDGDYYGVIYNCDEEDEARLAQSEEVTQSCRMGIVGVAEKGFGIEHELSLSNRVYVAIGSVDADFFDTMGVRLIEGRLPENDSEVIIPQMMTTAGKEFHVGDTITWQIGERIGSDGRVIQHQEQRIEDRSSADFCEEETIQVEQTKTYTIVGVSTNPGYQMFAEPCFLVLTTGVQTTTSDIYLKTKSIDDTSDFIAENFGDHQSKINETLLRYFGQGVSDIRYMLFGMCAVLMVVIAIASVALIYNSFSISLTERTRQFGLFKSIGATRFQVMTSVFFEAGFLAVSAIPAGLFIGCAGVSCVFKILKNNFDAMINSAGAAYAGSVSIIFYTKVWYLVVAAVAGIITILVSAMVPALRAGRISPIEAIRQTNDIKDSKFARNIRGRGILGTVFGVGGLIAHRNAKRNKKSYRAISFSLAICLFLFLGGSGFIYYMRLSMKGLNVPYYYNYHIQFNSIYNDLGMPPQTDQYEANMMRILNVCLMCFLILIVLISLANIANTITTAVRLRTREYAMIKAAGCSKHTFLRMIFAENLSYTLRGFVIGGLMGALANYKSYSYLKYSIYTNKVIPIGLYAVGAAAFILVMIFSTVYTWRKVKRGNICEELRQEAV